MKLKKGRTKRNAENTISEKYAANKKTKKEVRRKTGEKYKLDQDGAKKPKKSNNKKEAIVRSDSPGIDLSIFEPRGKRRCVIQNEMKKQDWWSDGEEGEDMEDEEEIEDQNNREELDGGQRNGTVEHHNDTPYHSDNEEEIEEEIIDDDPEEVVENLKKKNNPKKEIEKVNTKRKTPTKHTTNGDMKEKKIDRNTDNRVSVGSKTRYVFSTAMANRAGHFVNKGLYDSISKFHAAQEWDTPYLSAEIHCRPFIAQLEDRLLEQKDAKKELTRPDDTPVEKTARNTPKKVKNEENPIKTPLTVVTTNKIKEDPNDTRKNVSPDQLSGSKAMLTSEQQQQQMHANTQPIKMEDIYKLHKQNQQVSKSSVEDECSGKLNNALHPRFHLYNTQLPLSNHPPHAVDADPQTPRDPKKSEKYSPTEQKNNRKNPTTVNGGFLKQTPSPTVSSSHENKNNEKSPNTPAIPPTSTFEDPSGNNSEKEKKCKPTNTYPAEITDLKQQYRYQSPKPYNMDNFVDTNSSTCNSMSKASDTIRPTVISKPENRHPPEHVVRSSIDVAEKQLKESRVMKRTNHSAPIVPRDIRTASGGGSFLPTRLAFHLRPPFKGYSGGEQQQRGLLNGNSMFQHHPHKSSFSPVTSSSSSAHHYQHPREAIENMIDFSRYPTLGPLRPAVTRLNNGTSGLPPESYNHKPPSEIPPFSAPQHRKDRPSSLPVPTDGSSEITHSAPLRNSFSIETLSKSHRSISNDRDVTKPNSDENLHRENSHRLEGRIPLPPLPVHPSAFHERLLPPNQRDLHAPRLPTSNGIDIHSSLKRTLDEQLSKDILRAENQRKYLDKLHEWRRAADNDRKYSPVDERLIEKDRLALLEKDRRAMLEKDPRSMLEKDRRALLEKDRIALLEKDISMLEKERLLLGATRPLFPPDPRTPLHIPASYLSRTPVPNGGQGHSDIPVSHVLYNQILRSDPYSSVSRFPHR